MGTPFSNALFVATFLLTYIRECALRIGEFIIQMMAHMCEKCAVHHIFQKERASQRIKESEPQNQREKKKKNEHPRPKTHDTYSFAQNIVELYKYHTGFHTVCLALLSAVTLDVILKGKRLIFARFSVSCTRL